MAHLGFWGISSTAEAEATGPRVLIETQPICTGEMRRSGLDFFLPSRKTYVTGRTGRRKQPRRFSHPARLAHRMSGRRLLFFCTGGSRNASISVKGEQDGEGPSTAVAAPRLGTRNPPRDVGSHSLRSREKLRSRRSASLPAAQCRCTFKRFPATLPSSEKKQLPQFLIP